MKLKISDGLKVKKYNNPEFIVKILKQIKGLNVPRVVFYDDMTITFEYIEGQR